MTLAVLERGYGAEKPLPEKRPVQQVSSELKTVFEKWLKHVQNFKYSSGIASGHSYPYYATAKDFLEKAHIETSADEVEALIANYAEVLSEKNINAGDFLSAYYSIGTEDFYVYRGCGDANVSAVGGWLPKGKILIIPETAGLNHVGSRASGTIVYNAFASLGKELHKITCPAHSILPDSVCQDLRGLCIINGNAKNAAENSEGLCIINGGVLSAGLCADGITVVNGECVQATSGPLGVVLTLKTVQLFHRGFLNTRTLLTLDENECAQMPELQQYIDEITRDTLPHNPLEKIIEAARKLDKQTIENRIKEILREGGYYL